MLAKRIYIFLLIMALSFPAFADRLQDNNVISWNTSLNTIYLSKRVSFWLEYQWRREDLLRNCQQSMIRPGIQYHFKNGMSTMAGYGYIITYAYGDYPPGPHRIPEHRIFEQLVWNESIGRVTLNHRLRLEQRLMGKVNQKAEEYNVGGWNYMNRARYQLRANVPINHKTFTDKTWFASAYDELLIGFGSNVNQSIFDQNRIGVLVGYQFNKMFKIEGGFIHQTLQQGGLVNGREVIQYNSGAMLNVYFTKPPRS